MERRSNGEGITIMLTKVSAGIAVAGLAAMLLAGVLVARKSLDVPAAGDGKPARGSVVATR